MDNRTKFNGLTIAYVWGRAIEVPGLDRRLYRKDRCGSLMKRDEYGQSTPMGWEIDHVKPLSKGGSNKLGNLQALHQENNRRKGDSWPWHYRPAA